MTAFNRRNFVISSAAASAAFALNGTMELVPAAHAQNTTAFPPMWFVWYPNGKPLITLQDGAFCPSSQPAWSAYREPSFGHGVLTIQARGGGWL